MKPHIVLVAIGLIALLATFCLADNKVVLVTWNVESGGANPVTVGNRMGSMPSVELWGLCEVMSSEWIRSFEVALDPELPCAFEGIVGTTGGSDRLAIIYSTEELELKGFFEISWEDRSWWTSSMKPRYPLVAHFLHKLTGQEFYFMVNHLYRGDGVDPRRLDQATALSEWAAEQVLLVVAVGDYNFDWDLDPDESGANYNKGFGHMTADSVFFWVIPENLVKTHDSSYNSILDFVFLANAAGKVTAQSRILVEPGDFPDDQTTPDHRPVEALLTFTDSTEQDVLLEIESVSSPINPGQYATLVARTIPRAKCSIIVLYKSGASTAEGLEDILAGADGRVSWTWKVGTRTTSGTWRIVVSAELDGETVCETTSFQVR